MSSSCTVSSNGCVATSGAPPWPTAATACASSTDCSSAACARVRYTSSDSSVTARAADCRLCTGNGSSSACILPRLLRLRRRLRGRGAALTPLAAARRRSASLD